jgi:hypothetical protein
VVERLGITQRLANYAHKKEGLTLKLIVAHRLDLFSYPIGITTRQIQVNHILHLKIGPLLLIPTVSQHVRYRSIAFCKSISSVSKKKKKN